MSSSANNKNKSFRNGVTEANPAVPSVGTCRDPYLSPTPDPESATGCDSWFCCYETDLHILAGVSPSHGVSHPNHHGDGGRV